MKPIVTVNSPYIRVYPDVLSKARCREILDIVEKAGEPVVAFDQTRRGASLYLEGYDTLRQHIADMVGVPVELAEPLRVTRYTTGEYYAAHYDWFHVGEERDDYNLARSGQRTYTALVYLNDDFEGGETDFPAAGVRVVPYCGAMLVFRNSLEGEVDSLTLHRGMTVSQGTKYLLTTWFCERPFLP